MSADSFSGSGGPGGGLHRHVLESLPGAAITVIDDELRVELAAGGGFRDAGIDPALLAGVGLLEGIPVSKPERLELAARQALRGEDVRIELVLGGSGRHCAVHFVPLGRSPGEGPSVLAAWLDVTESSKSVDELRRRARDLETLGRAAGALARSTTAEQARLTVCTAAAEVAGADLSILFEFDTDHNALLATASHGVSLAGRELALAGTSGAGTAFRSGRPLFIADVRGHPSVEQAMVEKTGAVSVLWQPVIRLKSARGVVAVVWRAAVPELSARVAGMMELVAAEAAVAIERAAALDRLIAFSRTDALTSVLNRRAWEDELEREIARSARTGEPLTVVMLDLDHFKAFNDDHGHGRGDSLLAEVAEEWGERLRVTDVLARYGGDEFAMAMPACSTADATPLADRLLGAVPAGITASAGLAEWKEGESAESVLERADRALYEAKRAGGGVSRAA